MWTRSLQRITVGLLIAVCGFALPRKASAHCDTIDGPVVAAARVALERSDVTPALKWVHSGDEGTIRAAFAKAVAVRALSSEARDLADNWFFETLVRVHREGEGAPYTGLKPAAEVEPGIVLADTAIASGKIEPVISSVTQEIARGIRERFALVKERQQRAETSVQAGRDYVETYIDFIHYVERVHASARGEGPPAHDGNRSETGVRTR